MDDMDSAWKEFFDHHLPAILLFFFADIYADLDWTRDPESLEQEMRKLYPAPDTQ
jgi:hypothetical protein